MSSQQFQNFRRFKNLLGDLRHFGLNPNEWRIERETDAVDKLILKHRYDRDFKLAGQLDLAAGDRPHFSGLSIISL